jgi:hypothetical protein
MKRTNYATARDADELASRFANAYHLPIGDGPGAQARLELALLRRPRGEPALSAVWRNILNGAKRAGMVDPRAALYLSPTVLWARWLAETGHLRGDLVDRGECDRILSVLPPRATRLMFAGLPRSQRAWRMDGTRSHDHVFVVTERVSGDFRLDIIVKSNRGETTPVDWSRRVRDPEAEQQQNRRRLAAVRAAREGG